MKSLSNLLKSERIRFDKSQILYKELLGCEAPRLYTGEEKAAAETKAAHIIARAREEADGLLEEAEAQREEIFALSREEGYKAGFDEGQEQGLLQARSQSQAALDEIAAFCEQLDAEKSSYILKTQKQILDLSFHIAEKILNQTLARDEAAFLKIYEKAVLDLTAQRWLKITVSEQEKDIVTKSGDYLLSLVSGAEKLEIKIAENAAPGYCVIETAESIIDAGINVQLDALKKAVLY